MAMVVYKDHSSSVGVGTDADDSPTITCTSPSVLSHNSPFVGLENQGATCYLNGLIQTLFMTPEFRRAVFMWNFDTEKDGCEDLCIPLQLQKLFGRLQLHRQSTVDTVALTKSFGWEGFEVFQQQDVQELTRVLFDALEETFKGTAVEGVIDELFGGELVDYLRCIDVQYESERIDKFLDFSLAIVPFDSSIPMKCLEECIETFLRPEILEGDDKYYVESMNQRVDAIKGLKFQKLPQILSIQLKRFVYDFSGDYVVQKKLNDEVKFPMVLDMNKYVSRKRVAAMPSSSSTTEAAAVESVTDDQFIPNEEFEHFLQTQMSKLKHHQLSSVEKDKVEIEDEDSDSMLRDPEVPSLADQPTYSSMTREEINSLLESRGEFVYELYAVLVHRGAINGGHYYAFIKDQRSGKWYEFNDSLVTPIDEATVRQAWGSSSSSQLGTSSLSALGGYGGTIRYPRVGNAATAYMLLYHKARKQTVEESSTTSEDPSAAEDLCPNSVIPQYILDAVVKEEEAERKRRQEEEELRNKLHLRVMFQGKEHTVYCSRKDSLKALLLKLWDQLKLSTAMESPIGPDVTTVDLIRLRLFNSYTKVVQDVFSMSSDAQHGESSLDSLLFSDYKTYLLEVRQPGDEWEEFIKDGLTLSIDVYDELSLSFQAPQSIRVSATCTVAELKAHLLAKKIVTFTSTAEEIRVLRLLSVGYTDARGERLGRGVDSMRLKDQCGLYDNAKLHVERETAPDRVREDLALAMTPEVSPSMALYIENRNRLSLRVVLSSVPNRDPAGQSSASSSASTYASVAAGTKSSADTSELTVLADGRWKVRMLRARVAELFNIPIAECRLLKTSALGVELKEEEMQLAQQGLYSSMSIFVVRGLVTKPGEFRLSVTELIDHDDTRSIGVLQLPAWARDNKSNDSGQWSPIDEPLSSDSSCNDAVASHVVSIARVGPAVAIPLTEDESAKERHRGTHTLQAERVQLVDEQLVRVHMGEARGQDIEDANETDSDAESVQGQCSSLDEDPIEYALEDLVADGSGSEAAGLSSLQYPSGTTAASKALDAVSPLSVSNIAMDVAGQLLDDCDSPARPSAPAVEPSSFGDRSVMNSSESETFYPIEGMDLICAYPTLQVAELRALITNALIRCGKLEEGASPHRVRLRDRYAYAAGKILRDGKSLVQSAFYVSDNKMLAVTILPEEEVLPVEESGDIVVTVQVFHRSTWSLSRKVEVLLPGDWQVNEIASGLSLLFDIPFHSLRVLVVSRDTTFPLFELAEACPPHNYGRQWIDPTNETKLQRFMSHDFRLIDNDLLILTDESESCGSLTESDLLSIELVRAADTKPESYGSGSKTSYSSEVGPKNYYDSYWSTGTSRKGTVSAVSPAPSGIRIKTHKDRIKEQEEQLRKGDSDSNLSLKDELPAPMHSNGSSAGNDEFEKQGGAAMFEDLTI